MIPLTRKQFNILVIVIFSILFIVSIFVYIKYTNYKNERKEEQKVTPEMEAELEKWTEVASATRRIINDDPLWYSAEKEASLIAETIEKDMDFKVYATYRTDGNEEFDCYIYGGKIPKIKNKTVRETIKMKLTHSLAASTASANLRKVGRPVELSSVKLEWRDKNGVQTLIDSDANGVWDNKPSE